MVDLASPDIRGLRTFFKTLGSDVSGGRESFASLCRLHGAIRAFENNPRSIGDAIAVLQGDMGSQPAVLARSMVAKSAFACVEMLDDAGYEFLWKHIDHIDLRLDDAATSTFFRTAWLRSPRRIAGLPMGKSAIASALNRVWDDADVATLITGISLAPDFADRVVARRSDLTGHSAFWEIGSVGAGHLQFALGDDGRQSAVAAMYVAGRGELAMAAVREFGARIILAAIATAATEPGLPIRPWIGAACTDPGGVAAYLVSGDIVHRWLLLALAHQQEPDAVPNEVGADPWLLAWQRSQGKLDDAGAVFIFAFLLSRALGRHTRSPAELALIAFEATHDAAARGAIPDDAWGLLERRLPRASIWSDWDRCRQIREGIVEAFVDNQLSPAQFACLTERISLFRPLAETAAATSRGRKYLRLVKQTLASSRHRSSAERLRAVEAALD
ncbi:MAG: hypothetical protein IH627_12085 [Rubrivivax sp.]|nr:hypothetical protein [Rubrivivax sp.]